MPGRPYLPGCEPLQLADRQLADGTTESYVLQIGHGAVASLKVETDGQRGRVFLGLRVAGERVAHGPSGDKERGGLLVDGTYPDSAASAAGVEAGDLVLSVAGQQVGSAQQLQAVEAALPSGTPVTVRLLHGGRVVERILDPVVVRERVVDVQWVELDGSKSPCKYSGIVLNGIPRVWSRRMFGDVGSGVVIVGVDVGSPAWLAGIRVGDYVQAVDGGSVPSLAGLCRLLDRRGRDGASVALRVQRGEAVPHEAHLQLADYRQVEQVWLPGLFDLEDACGHRAWSAGPLGLLAGGYSRDVAAPDRKSTSRGYWHGLLGLVQVDSRAQATQLRLFWFLEFEI